MPRFVRYIGVDYSGADKATKPLAGLRVFLAEKDDNPEEVRRPHPGVGHWDRRTLAAWLTDRLRESTSTIVGIDHCFSLPDSHLDRHGLDTWDQVLEDVAQHWPTDVTVRSSIPGNPRMGDPTEYRLAECWAPSSKSVFQHRGQGTVFYSTHAGLPWLLEMRRELGNQVHFWPFDGFQPPEGVSVIAEVYPALFKRRYPADFPTTHQLDAYATCRWLQDRDHYELLADYFKPPLTKNERSAARREGWILGVA